MKQPLPFERKSERVSEYFDFRTWPEKANRKVTRAELLAFLTRAHLVGREKQLHRRAWRWLQSRIGSAKRPIGGGYIDEHDDNE